MERDLIHALKQWSINKRRKPLVLNGARQVGKTWLLQHFAETNYETQVYINFDNNERAQAILQNYTDIDGVVKNLETLSGTKINADSTLIIFDEIQQCPAALTSLKYFCEQRPELHVAAAGSLLGLTVHYGTGFPVGKVNFLNLYPLTFCEFLTAIGKQNFRELIDTQDYESMKVFAPDLISLLKTYFLVGGMPEAVASFADDGNFQEVRQVQNEILNSYVLDISKHAQPNEIGRILQAWRSVPGHLSRVNKKFIFSDISPKARARDYKPSIEWLKQSGMVIEVPRVTKPEIPLSAYNDNVAFKLFLVDVGLLLAMMDVDVTSVLEGNELFSQFKGALTEQYVCQQLLSSMKVTSETKGAPGTEFASKVNPASNANLASNIKLSNANLTPYYWSNNSSQCEIDFMVQNKGNVYAIEVKAGTNVKSKSLRVFKQKFENVQALRFSLLDYKDQDWVVNVPLYAIDGFFA